MNFLLPWLNTCHHVPATCVCACHCILNCVYVLKCRNRMWLGSIYNMCMTSQIVWWNSKWGKTQRKENVCTVCLYLCPCLSETVCTRTFCMWLHCFDTLSCPYLQLKTVSSWDGSLTSILTRDTFVWRYTYTYIYIYNSIVFALTMSFFKRRRGWV